MRSHNATIIVFTLLTFISSPGLAHPFFSQFQKMPSQIHQKDQNTVTGQGSCTNFSGHWKGTCNEQMGSNQEQTEESHVIEQDGCFDISVDGYNLNLGGRQVYQESTKDISNDFIAFPDWAENNTEISIQIVTANRSMGSFIRSNSVGKYRFFMRNGKLVTQLTSNGTIESGAQEYHTTVNIECVMEKQD